MTRNRNHERADWAATALKTYRRQVGVDDCYDAVHDLIADLGHYAKRQGHDFLPLVARALNTWAAEVEYHDEIDPGPSVYIRLGNETTLRPTRKGGAS